MHNTFAAFELRKEWLVLFSDTDILHFDTESERMINLLQQGLKKQTVSKKS